MPRYLLTVADRDTRLLESWFSGALIIAPAQGDGADPLKDLRSEDGHVRDKHRGEADRRLALLRPVPVASLDAITEQECIAARGRLSQEGPLYHGGHRGPEPAPANVYEAAHQRLSVASEDYRLARETAERIVRRAESEYSAAETNLRRYETSPGIPLPEYRTG